MNIEKEAFRRYPHHPECGDCLEKERYLKFIEGAEYVQQQVKNNIALDDDSNEGKTTICSLCKKPIKVKIESNIFCDECWKI